MTPNELDGTSKIKVTLSWPGLWSILVALALVLFSYWGMKEELKNLRMAIGGFYTKVEIDKMKTEAEQSHASLERRDVELQKQINRINKRLGLED